MFNLQVLTLLAVSSSLFNSVTSLPPDSNVLDPRAAVDNIVSIRDANTFCMIMPRDAHTNIGDSEHPGGMKTYCSPAGRTSTQQGQLPADFWKSGQVALKKATGKNGQTYAQLTGCINPSKLSRLNPNDSGGQYDSNGGAGGKGNPQGSACVGYKYYVELVEPAGPRACLRCCNDKADCPTNKDEAGCPTVIPGNYFTCK